MITVLIIGLEKDEFSSFEDFCSQKGFSLICCEEYADAIREIEKGKVDLVICNSGLKGEIFFKVYHVIEPFLKKNNIPVFLIVERNKVDLVNLALEIGIDNLIFRPYNFSVIEKKIQNHFRKIRNIRIHKNEHFQSFYKNNTTPMLIIQKGKIKSYNHSFSELYFKGSHELIKMKFSHLFQIENDPIKYHQFKRLESGLVSFCNIENVQLGRLPKEWVDLFMVRDVAGSIIVQINQSKNCEVNKLEHQMSKGFAGLDKSVSSKLTKIKLTKREMDVCHLSAKGLPIKIIAQKLSISPRTVEKHRANIMEKLGAKNMIEAITKI